MKDEEQQKDKTWTVRTPGKCDWVSFHIALAYWNLGIGVVAYSAVVWIFTKQDSTFAARYGKAVYRIREL